MTSFKKFCLMTFVSLLAVTINGNATTQELVSIALDKVFVPKGFDSNDNVEIVASGELPNTCYLRPFGEVKSIENKIIIDLKAYQVVGNDVNCIQAIVPYMISVSLGQLAEGRYEIIVNGGTSSEKNSAIFVERPSSSSLNNFTYANVTNVKKTLLNDREILIEGYHPSSCMEIDRVEIITNENQDAYSVLPIIKQVLPICDQMIKPFSYTIQLPPAHRDQQLVHVRKIDGWAFNYIIKVLSVPK
jgi:hypothetical protein